MEELIIVNVYENGDKTDCSNYRGISLVSMMYKLYPTSCCQGELQIQRKLLGIIKMDFDAKGQLLIIHSASVKHFRKKMALQ